MSLPGGVSRRQMLFKIAMLFNGVVGVLLGLPVLAAPHSEATALGAAFLAGLHIGFWKNEEELRKLLAALERHEPRLPEEERQRRLTQWRRAVRAVIAFYSEN